MTRMFQSTPARSGRPSAINASGNTIMFQSTPARSGRHKYRRLIAEPLVSIHARAKRATKTTKHARSPATGFNPRPREAGDKRHRSYKPQQIVSIHARAKRATSKP